MANDFEEAGLSGGNDQDWSELGNEGFGVVTAEKQKAMAEAAKKKIADAKAARTKTKIIKPAVIKPTVITKPPTVVKQVPATAVPANKPAPTTKISAADRKAAAKAKVEQRVADLKAKMAANKAARAAQKATEKKSIIARTASGTNIVQQQNREAADQLYYQSQEAQIADAEAAMPSDGQTTDDLFWEEPSEVSDDEEVTDQTFEPWVVYTDEDGNQYYYDEAGNSYWYTGEEDIEEVTEEIIPEELPEGAMQDESGFIQYDEGTEYEGLTNYSDAPKKAMGNLYEYNIVDYPFMGPRTIKGKRWVVAAKTKDGSVKLIRSDTKESALDLYKKAKAAGEVTGETPVVYDNIKGQLEEKAGMWSVYKPEDWIDLGPAELDNPVSGGLISGLTNFYHTIMDSIIHKFEIR